MKIAGHLFVPSTLTHVTQTAIYLEVIISPIVCDECTASKWRAELPKVCRSDYELYLVGRKENFDVLVLTHSHADGAV